jgi:hypothetical protein
MIQLHFCRFRAAQGRICPKPPPPTSARALLLLVVVTPNSLYIAPHGLWLFLNKRSEPPTTASAWRHASLFPIGCLGVIYAP